MGPKKKTDAELAEEEAIAKAEEEALLQAFRDPNAPQAKAAE